MPEYLSTELQTAFADSYGRAAREGADMRAVAASIENIRDSLAKQPSFPDAMAAFDEEIGLASPKILLGLLAECSEVFQRSASARVVAFLNSEFTRDPASGWNSWLKEYVESFDERGWQTRYAWRITDGALAFSPFADWPVNRIRDSVQCIFQSRWPEAYDWVVFLAQQDLAPARKANFLVTAAEIQFYHFLQPTKALPLLEQAKTIAADDPRVLNGWGEYFLQLNELDEARKYFEQLTQKWPQLDDGWIGLGDCSEKAEDLDAAEDQFEQAIANVPSTSSPYRRMISLLGRRRNFERYGEQISLLFTRMLALEDEPAGARVDLAVIYKQNEMPDEARKHFLQAIAENPAYVNAYAWLGYTEIDQKRMDAARENFEKVIHDAPHALDGYWGMSVLAEQAEQWDDAIGWCDRATQCHAEWESSGRSRRGELLRKSGNLKDAEIELFRSLDIESKNPSALESLSLLADDLLERNDAPGVERTLQALRRWKGESYEFMYQNRLGNLRYSFKDYVAAAEHYRKAIASNANDDVLYSNLALALERLSQPEGRVARLEEASTALRHAAKLEPNNKEYAERLEALELENGFIATYGEDALKYAPSVTPIRIELVREALGDILDSGSITLSQDTLAKIDSMRQWLRERYGFTLPGVLFGQLWDILLEGNYRIVLRERELAVGTVNPGQKFLPTKTQEESHFPPQGNWTDDTSQNLAGDERWGTADYVLYHLRTMLETRLADFFGHEDTALALKDCRSEAAVAIRESDKEFTAFVQMLRGLLAKQIPIVNLDSLCEQFHKVQAGGVDASAAALHFLNEASAEAIRSVTQTNNQQLRN